MAFFSQYKDSTDLSIYEELHKIRKVEYSKLFNKEYDPGMSLNNFDLACLDPTKTQYIDLEADVCKENHVYTDVINMYIELTNGVFKPKNISEIWKTANGPIEVKFDIDGKTLRFKPQYEDDWLDPIVFQICEESLKSKNIRFVTCMDNEQYGFGQAIPILRLTKNEQKNLEKEFNWKFAGSEQIHSINN